MNLKRRPSRSYRHNSQCAAARTASRRRLRFERCEQRLPLSGNSAVEVDPLQSEGGFSAIYSGEFLTPASSDFVSADAGSFTSAYSLSNDDPLSANVQNVLIADPPTFAFRILNATTGAGVGSLSNGGSNVSNGGVETGSSYTGANELPDVITTRPIINPDGPAVGFGGPTAMAIFPKTATVEVVANHLELMFSDLQETLQISSGNLAKAVKPDALPEADTPLSQSAFTTFDESPSLLGLMVLQEIEGTQQQFSMSRDHGGLSGDQLAVIDEGGPIDVAAAVTHTQQAYESELFSAVAMVLDEQGTLDEPAPPVQQPLASELARAVTFKLASSEGIPSVMPLDDAFEPGSKASAEPTADVPLSRVDEETELSPSRAVAFAQWPLVFPASVGALIVAWRRRTQPGFDQQPPRLNRKTDSL